MNIERNIIKNANYIVSYFSSQDKKVTPLMLQKLLYFLEAIYMVVENQDKLFDEEFSAWNFGPVNSVIYNKYKKFGNFPIELDEKLTIPEINKKYIIALYKLFKDFEAYQLVGLSHSNGSPWYKLNEKYEKNIPKNEIIDKQETKEWFSTLVKVDSNEG